MVYIVKLLFELLEIIVREIVNLFFDMVTAIVQPIRKEVYDAHFINAQDILYKNNGGFTVDGVHTLGEDSFKHVICYGNSGSGKSSTLCIPFCLGVEQNSSIIINDFSGETMRLTATHFKSRGFKVKVLNWCEPSEGFNPLARIKNENESDINSISQTIIANTIGFGNDKFWSISAQGMISTFISLALKSLPIEQRTLSCVYQLITMFAGDPVKTDKLVARVHSDRLIAEYKAYVAMDNKLLMNIITSAKIALQIFDDPAVALATSINTIGDFESLRTEPTVVYITNSIPRAKLYAPVSALYIESLLSYLMESSPYSKDENSIYFLLEEAGSLFIKSLPTAVAVLRKSGVAILQIYQHKSQLKQYGELAESIHANAYTKIYMGAGGIPIQIAEELTRSLGQFEYFDEDIRRVMPLMSPESIMQMNENLIFVGSNRPIKTKVTPYYKNKKLLKFTQLPLYIPENKIPYATAPQINLD